MRILLWQVHGPWTASFVQGDHEYLLPVTPGRDEDGVGCAQAWDWPERVREVTPAQLRDAEVDVVVLQRPHETELATRWLGRRPGVDVPAVYVEHDPPLASIPDTVHPMAGQDRIRVVHVTGFNQLFWDCGRAPTSVIELGIVDPGHRYTGEIDRSAVVVNDPVRRGRAVGTDLLPTLRKAGGVDVFGVRVEALRWTTGLHEAELGLYEDLPQPRLHEELARRRVYVHTARWTSLGVSLLEAMHLGMPVVALAATEATMVIPPEAGVVTTRQEEMVAAVAQFLIQPELAAEVGACARQHALERYGLRRFLADWDTELLRILVSR